LLDCYESGLTAKEALGFSPIYFNLGENWWEVRDWSHSSWRHRMTNEVIR
jgi:hypothetical protein